MGELSPERIPHNIVTVTTAATEIVPFNPHRVGVMIVNEGSTDVRIGGPLVTTANGVLLLGVKGANMPIPVCAAVYGIVAAGTQDVSYLEMF